MNPGSESTKIYATWWMKSIEESQSGKNFRVYFDSGETSDNVFFSARCVNNYFRATSEVNPDVIWASTSEQADDIWQRFEIYIDTADATDTYELWVDGIRQFDSSQFNGGTAFAGDGPWSIFFVDFGHMQGNPATRNAADGCSTDWNTTQDWDDIYFSQTYSRVEVCAGSTWSNKGVCEVQIPTAWATGEVSFVVNQGAFADDATAYLYVVDEDGDANTNGLEITIGGTGTPQTNTGTIMQGVSTVVAN
jgi:hypothetical protein